MNISKKFDRAFQWAGEKMGGEAKTSMSDDFKMLETEMALRFEGKTCPSLMAVIIQRCKAVVLTCFQAWSVSKGR